MKRKSASFVVTSLVLINIIFMLLFHTGAASYATRTPTSKGQQDEVTELKKQVAALEQRVGALEKQLAEIRKPKLIPAKGQP